MCSLTPARMRLRTQLNGRFGRVTFFDVNKGRAAVAVEGLDEPPLLIKPANLAMPDDFVDVPL